MSYDDLIYLKNLHITPEYFNLCRRLENEVFCLHFHFHLSFIFQPILFAHQFSLLILLQNFTALIYLFIYLFGAKKADRLTVGIESLQGLLKKSCECTYYSFDIATQFKALKFHHFDACLDQDQACFRILFVEERQIRVLVHPESLSSPWHKRAVWGSGNFLMNWINVIAPKPLKLHWIHPMVKLKASFWGFFRT